MVDPASNWPLFAEKAKQLLEKDKVDVIFGCWTSVSRKSVLPVLEEKKMACYSIRFNMKVKNHLKRFYTGAAPTSRQYRR